MLPLAVSLGWLCYDAPGPFWREAYFVLELLLVTVATRTITWGAATSALSLGVGIAAPAVVFAGVGLNALGLDVSESGVGSWGLVPVLEEALKLVPVMIVAWQVRRRSKMTLNPSDLLLIGCAAGAGFAMAENAQLVTHDPGVLRDMARQYGPSLLVPGAWGAAGYVGHAAATGFITAGYGLSIALRRRGRAISRLVLVAPLAYIVMEHMLANLRVDTGSAFTLILGNGRLTPWLFLVMAGAVIANDWRAARQTLTHSRILRFRIAVVRAAVLGQRHVRKPLWQRLHIGTQELRLLNATAWFTFDRRRP